MANTVKYGITAEDQGFKQTLSQAAQAASQFAKEVGASGKGINGLRQSCRIASKAVADLTFKYSQLTDEAKNSDFGREMLRQIKQAETAAAELTDMQADIKNQIKNMASDTSAWDATAQGIGVLSSGMQSLAGVVGMCGGDVKAFTQALTVMNTVQSVTNTIIGIGNAVQKDSALMVGLRNLRTKLLTTSLMKNTAAQALNTTATDAAKVSQLALNAAILANPYVIAAAAIAGICAGIYIWVSADNDLTKAEQDKRDAMIAVSEQMEKQSEKLGQQIGAFRILQSEYQRSDGDLNKMKSSMSNFDEICQQANITLKNQATAEKVLGELAPVMIKKYEAEAKAAAISAAIQGEYARILEKSAEIRQRIAEGKTIDTGDLEALNIDLSKVRSLGLQFENGLDDMIAEIFQPSARDLKLASGNVDEFYDKLLDEAFKGVEGKINVLASQLGDVYADFNAAVNELKNNSIDTNALFSNDTVKKAMTGASKSVKNTSKAMNTLLSTLEGCDNVIRKGTTDLNELDHKSADFAKKFVSLNATILAAKKSKFDLIDKSNLQGMNEARNLANDILQYAELNSDEYNEWNAKVNTLNNSIYEYLKQMASTGSAKAIKDCRNEIEKIIETLPDGSEEMLIWINRWRTMKNAEEEITRKLNNRKLNIQDGSATELKQQLDKAIQDLGEFKLNTKVTFTNAAEFEDQVKAMQEKAIKLAKEYSTQLAQTSLTAYNNLRPVDLTFSYKQSNIDKINEEIRYYSEKEKILKEYDIKIDDITTFNFFQSSLDETVKKLKELKNEAKFSEIKDDIKQLNSEAGRAAYDSFKGMTDVFKNMYSAVTDLPERLDECKDAFEGIFAVLDAGFSIVDSILSFIDNIQKIIELVNMLTGAKEALSTATNKDTLSTQLNTAATTGNTAASEGAAAAEMKEATASMGKAAANTAEAGTEAGKQMSKIGPWGWVAGIAAALAIAGALFGIMSQAKGFADGGIIKGSTTVGDKVLARVNAGEMILNNKQQSNLFKVLNEGIYANGTSGGYQTSQVRIKGDDMYIQMHNYYKKTKKNPFK